MPRNQDEIRAGLLSKLGIFPSETGDCETGSVPPTATSACSQNGRSSSKGRRVSFKDCVSVVEVPSYRDYDDTTRESLWSSGQEIQENALRNKIEFRAEGCNWRNAVLEDAMLQMPNGELLHPATYALLWEIFYLEYGYPFSRLTDTTCDVSFSANKSRAIRNVGLRPPLVPVEASEAMTDATCAYCESDQASMP